MWVIERFVKRTQKTVGTSLIRLAKLGGYRDYGGGVTSAIYDRLPHNAPSDGMGGMPTMWNKDRIGWAAWNTQWLLIIPGSQFDTNAGMEYLRVLIYGEGSGQGIPADAGENKGITEIELTIEAYIGRQGSWEQLCPPHRAPFSWWWVLVNYYSGRLTSALRELGGSRFRTCMGWAAASRRTFDAVHPPVEGESAHCVGQRTGVVRSRVSDDACRPDYGSCCRFVSAIIALPPGPQRTPLADTQMEIRTRRGSSARPAHSPHTCRTARSRVAPSCLFSGGFGAPWGWNRHSEAGGGGF